MTCLCAALLEPSIAGHGDTRDKNQYLEPNNRRNKMSLPVSVAVLALPFGEHFRRHQLMRNDRCCKCEWTDGFVVQSRWAGRPCAKHPESTDWRKRGLQKSVWNGCDVQLAGWDPHKSPRRRRVVTWIDESRLQRVNKEGEFALLVVRAGSDGASRWTNVVGLGKTRLAAGASDV